MADVGTETGNFVRKLKPAQRRVVALVCDFILPLIDAEDSRVALVLMALRAACVARR